MILNQCEVKFYLPS